MPKWFSTNLQEQLSDFWFFQFLELGIPPPPHVIHFTDEEIDMQRSEQPAWQGGGGTKSPMGWSGSDGFPPMCQVLGLSL